jgi:uncharacterized membrane protein
MASPASIKGHPIHAMLVPLPIGLWIFAFVCDLVPRVGWGGPGWSQAGFYALGAGIAGALLAAVPGLIDLRSLRDARVRKIGLTHMTLNLAAVGVFGLSFFLRLGGGVAGSGLTFALSALGIALISVSGWLGGEMVYVHGVGVEAKPPAPAA